MEWAIGKESRLAVFYPPPQIVNHLLSNMAIWAIIHSVEGAGWSWAAAAAGAAGAGATSLRVAPPGQDRPDALGIVDRASDRAAPGGGGYRRQPYPATTRYPALGRHGKVFPGCLVDHDPIRLLHPHGGGGYVRRPYPPTARQAFSRSIAGVPLLVDRAAGRDRREMDLVLQDCRSGFPA